MEVDKIADLRRIITENLRVQRDSESIDYINVGTALSDATAKQNHAIFARRGCGKTLLLHSSGARLKPGSVPVYLNCEDFKQHSFPNVLIEILTTIFSQFEDNRKLWFGKGRKSSEILDRIQGKLKELKSSADQVSEQVKKSKSSSSSHSADLGASTGMNAVEFGAKLASGVKNDLSTERVFSIYKAKLQELDLWLPELKRDLIKLFGASKTVKVIYLQVDDLYHLRRADQAFVVDYIHRLCKDIPVYFKIATLRHLSTLYVDKDGQPTGAQERHDYQPINIDYTFADFLRTRKQNWAILCEFAKRVGAVESEVEELFKGEGFARVVMAGGGVPRDVLSLFLEVLGSESSQRIGKDEVRVLSKNNFERRIEELKHDSQSDDQDVLLRGIYAIREFCLSKKTNVFLISEKELQQNDAFKSLIFRLLDYRIIHSCAIALTHKSQPGSYQAFAIDIGCYAHMRKLKGKFNEVDLTQVDAKEKVRSSPILSADMLRVSFERKDINVEEELFKEDETEIPA